MFWKIFKEEERDGKTKSIPLLRYYSVFNVAQCEGINAPASVEANGTFQPLEKCEQTVARMPRPPRIEHGRAHACYSPPEDKISLPEAALFESPEAYYSTLFHELTHATGHHSRLNRKEVVDGNRYGSDPYSREELVAEMGAAFLCGHCEIGHTTVDRSASYIKHWLGRLKDDRKLVVHAGAQAQRACDFILGAESAAPEPTVDAEGRALSRNDA